MIFWTGLLLYLLLKGWEESFSLGNYLVQQGKSKKEKGKSKNTYFVSFLPISDGSFISVDLY
jgi:hypothetical protein